MGKVPLFSTSGMRTEHVYKTELLGIGCVSVNESTCARTTGHPPPALGRPAVAGALTAIISRTP